MLRAILFAAAALLAFLFIAHLVRRHAGGYTEDPSSLARGKMLFTIHCASCHALKEDGIGPPLGGITELLSERQLTAFIRNPDQAIEGDTRARILHDRYKQTMPSYDWMDEDTIHALLSYIHGQTQRYQIKPLAVQEKEQAATRLTGKLVPPVHKSGLKIALQDFIQIPRLAYSTPDLGIVTLRPHPAGDGRLFVSDQGGVLYQIIDGKAEIFLDLRAYIDNFSIGPGLATGLGSFDFHPDFLRNGLFYMTHAEKFEGQPADYRIPGPAMAEVQWVLCEWKLEDVNARAFRGTRREILRLHAPTFGHGAQDIGFIPALPENHAGYGMLYLAFGDGGSNNIRHPELGHHRASFLGSILRIDPRGSNSRNGKYGIPADNPFADDTNTATLREIWAYGFRNPHRMTWDPSPPYRMLVTDIGESNIEEINIVEKGGDYGWPQREGTFGISPTKDLKTVFAVHPADRTLYKDPFAQYDHTDGFAISGGYIYDGPMKALERKYIFGDIVNGKLFYVNAGPELTDSTIYELTIMRQGRETSLAEMSGIKRLHLRIAYDRFSRKLYVITKADGVIRTVTQAYR